MDILIFQFLNNLAGKSALLDSVGIFFAEYSPYLWVLILIIVFFFPSPNKAKNRVMIVLGTIAALVSRYGVKSVILLFYDRPRPFVLLNSVHQLITTPISENFQSFPSGHAIFFFALASVIFHFHKKWGWWAYAFAALMGIARIFVGVHWPSDIAAGAILGIFTGWVITGIYERQLTK